MAQQFKNLFSPIEVGPFTLPNRIVCTAHGTYYDEHASGLPGEKQTGYWVGKAKGGTSLIMTEATFAHEHSYRNTFRSPQAVPMFKKAMTRKSKASSDCSFTGKPRSQSVAYRLFTCTRTWASSAFAGRCLGSG